MQSQEQSVQRMLAHAAVAKPELHFWSDPLSWVDPHNIEHNIESFEPGFHTHIALESIAGGIYGCASRFTLNLEAGRNKH